MLTAVSKSLRPVRVALILAAAVAAPLAANAAVVMNDHFDTDTSANWTQAGGNNPAFFNAVNSFVSLSGTPTSIQHNAAFNASVGDSTITTIMWSPTGIGGFQQDTAVVSGIASTSSSAFMGIRAYATARTVSLTTSAGDFALTTLPSFTTAGAILTLNLFPATAQYQVTMGGAGTTPYDSGLRSLAADVPGFSFGSLSSVSALLGSAAANNASTRGVNIDRITIDHVVPSPSALVALGVGAVCAGRRRRNG